MDNKDFLKTPASPEEPTKDTASEAKVPEENEAPKRKPRIPINLQDLFFNNFVSHTFSRQGLSYTLRSLTGEDSELVYACLEPAALKNAMAVDLAVELLQVACSLMDINGKVLPIRGEKDDPKKWLIGRMNQIKAKPAVLIDRMYDDFRLLTSELNFALNTPDAVGTELKN